MYHWRQHTRSPKMETTIKHKLLTGKGSSSMNSNLQRIANEQKAYNVIGQFDGLLVAIDHNRPDHLFITDKHNGLISGIDYKGQSFELDCFKMISKIHLDNLRNRIYDCCPNWYEKEYDKQNKGLIKEVIQFIVSKHPTIN